jgi:hypothetical protein
MVNRRIGRTTKRSDSSQEQALSGRRREKGKREDTRCRGEEAKKKPGWRWEHDMDGKKKRHQAKVGRTGNKNKGRIRLDRKDWCQGGYGSGNKYDRRAV